LLAPVFVMELNLTNNFLIAMPTLADPNFYQTVTYIFAHNEEGAMGIIINRPADLQLGELFSQMEISCEDSKVCGTSVYDGGPVQRERGFIIHRPTSDWECGIEVNDEIGVSTSRECLAAIAAGTGEQEMFVALGYAGWGSGQLENEIADNAWLNGPAALNIIFEMPAEQRWRASAELLGVDVASISPQAGHA